MSSLSSIALVCRRNVVGDAGKVNLSARRIIRVFRRLSAWSHKSTKFNDSQKAAQVELGLVKVGKKPLDLVIAGETRMGQGHTRVIVESLTVPVRFDMISQQKRDEMKPTRPLTASGSNMLCRARSYWISFEQFSTQR